MTLSSSDLRGGRSPLLTASELSFILPIPLLMIVEGYAQPLFPSSNTAHPSPTVVIVNAKPKRTYPPAGGLPLHINCDQWNTVVVPLIRDGVLSYWRGQIQSFGDLVSLASNIVDPEGSVVFPIGTTIGYSAWTAERQGMLFGCDPTDVARVGGKSSQYLELVGGLIYQAAVEAGY